MTKRLFIYICFFASFHTVVAQDLFSFENSKKFGEYLLKSGQYEIASREYERLVYLKPADDTLKLNLLKAYRLSNRTDLGIMRTLQLFPDQSALPFDTALEYSKLLLNKQDWIGAREFWKESKNLPADEKILLNTTVSIFESDFKAANGYLSKIQNKENYLAKNYASILDRGNLSQMKSPALAGIMSTIIPGSGKAYTKNWKDGLVSMIFVGGMAFQSYRNFSNKGFKNYRGWVYGGIGLGFYLGNIYGSVKSAKNYNKKKINALQHEASTHFNLYY